MKELFAKKHPLVVENTENGSLMMLGATNTTMKLEIYDLQQEIADQKDIIRAQRQSIQDLRELVQATRQDFRNLVQATTGDEDHEIDEALTGKKFRG